MSRLLRFFLVLALTTGLSAQAAGEAPAPAAATAKPVHFVNDITHQMGGDWQYSAFFALLFMIAVMGGPR